MHTLSYVSGTSDAPLLGETIGENLRRTVERFPDHEAAVIAHQSWRCTYRELWEQSGTLGRALMARGIEKGDRVGMWAPNRFEWVVAQYATARIGAIMVNVNPAYRAHELEYALKQSGMKLLLMAQNFRATNYVEIFESIKDNCPELKGHVVLDTGYESLLSEAERVSDEDLAKRERTLSFDDAINIQYTSGTTGLPKGATLSHHNILNNGYFIARKMNYNEADRVCVPVPFYHCFGMVIGNLACTSTGACIVVPNEFFDAETTMEIIQGERCTSIYGVPTMFIAQLNHPRFEEFDFT
ncbi:MAG: AMP-binding protein, partial [Myxococcota bacterium]